MSAQSAPVGPSFHHRSYKVLPGGWQPQAKSVVDVLNVRRKKCRRIQTPTARTRIIQAVSKCRCLCPCLLQQTEFQVSLNPGERPTFRRDGAVLARRIPAVSRTNQKLTS